jgi:hypothetical protein
MLCAPLPHSLRIDGLPGTNDTIDSVTLKQLRAGILERCFPGRLTTPYVALIDCTMQDPFRHSFPRRFSRTAHSVCPKNASPATIDKGIMTPNDDVGCGGLAYRLCLSNAP